jgi:hypothetical protein
MESENCSLDYARDIEKLLENTDIKNNFYWGVENASVALQPNFPTYKDG